MRDARRDHLESLREFGFELERAKLALVALYLPPGRFDEGLD